MRGILRIALTLLVCSIAGEVVAAERGSPAEAQAMLEKAIAHYKQAGRNQAFSDFTKKQPPFADRDLYVVCLAADHKIVANGGFPHLVGNSADQLKDADGKPLGASLWGAAGKGDGSVRYRWMNPLSGKTEPKISFVQKVGEDLCAVGAYTQ